MSAEAALRMSKQDIRTSSDGIFVGASDKSLGQGSIVNVSSGAGVRGHPALAAYCASKHGVNGVTKAMSKDWPNIRMNVVAPGKYYFVCLEVGLRLTMHRYNSDTNSGYNELS